MLETVIFHYVFYVLVSPLAKKYFQYFSQWTIYKNITLEEFKERILKFSALEIWKTFGIW